jgi:hypothetical protein
MQKLFPQKPIFHNKSFAFQASKIGSAFSEIVSGLLELVDFRAKVKKVN